MMDSETYLIFGILWTHFIADFVMQSHWMATNKSKSNIALFYHVSVYTLTWFFFGIVIVLFSSNSMAELDFNFRIFLELIWFFPMTFAAHYATDWITSRWTAYLWEKKDVHNFFVVIGFDQFLHLFTIYLTLRFLTNG